LTVVTVVAAVREWKVSSGTTEKNVFSLFHYRNDYQDCVHDINSQLAIYQVQMSGNNPVFLPPTRFECQLIWHSAPLRRKQNTEIVLGFFAKTVRILREEEAISGEFWVSTKRDQKLSPN
jgi:hypothetical protein